MNIFKYLSALSMPLFLSIGLIFSLSSFTVDNKACDARLLSELPKEEQFAHKSLMSKGHLLGIHRDYLMKESAAVVTLMKLLGDNESNLKRISVSVLSEVIEKSCFPDIQEIKSNLETIVEDKFVGFKARHCLQLLDKGVKNEISNYFMQIENEMLNDINCFADEEIDLPQYKYMVSLYTKAREGVIARRQMLLLMYPPLFEYV